MYCRRLTKEDLIKSGITNITEDACVFKKDREITPDKIDKYTHYLMLNIYDLDENGNRVKYINKKTGYYNYKPRRVGLHRAVYAWFHNEVPEGFTVDHIDNHHNELIDYRLENLQAITPKENVNKDRTNKDVKSKFYKATKRRYVLADMEAKLNKYTEMYEEAKANHDANKAHKLRSNIFQWRHKIEEVKANPDLLITKEELVATKAAKKEASLAKHKIVECRKKAAEVAVYYKNESKSLWHAFNKLANTKDLTSDDMYNIEVAYETISK